MQGFFQVASFIIPLDPELSEAGDTARVEYIIMSRRSRDRAGLRYQRRGVDDEAHVANFVETETVIRLEVCGPKNSRNVLLMLLFLRERTLPTSLATSRLEDPVSRSRLRRHYIDVHLSQFRCFGLNQVLG